MSAVLIDGSPSSVRALELASLPNLFTPHETSQLLLLHTWAETKDVAQLAAIPQTVDFISKSRSAQFSLNYKIESFKLPTLTESPVALHPSSTTVSPIPTTSTTPAPGEKAKPAAGKKDGSKGVDSTLLVAKQSEKVDRSPQDFAREVIKYAEDRAQHHDLKTFFLGVGGSLQGKVIAVGSVAKQAMRTFRGKRNLFFMKATGPVIRPNASFRVLVLVLPGSDDALSGLRHVLELFQPKGRGDRVGVVIVANNGKPKPNPDVVSVAEPGADDSGVVSKACVKLLAEYGLSDNVDDAGASTVANETFPLINTLVLDPTNQIATPIIDEVPNQLTKYIAGIKVDFLALPPQTKDGAMAEGLANACLAAPKPHVLLF